MGIVNAVFCGAVDDGKSTLLGRLLADTGSVPVDDIDRATTGDTIDYSLLTDGLQSEQEQGITIDVAYRHLFLANGMRLLIADCPGHEQYTRNMAVAASKAQLAVLVIDSAHGLRTQSFRHAAICAAMGVRHLVVAVNKLDAFADPAARFAAVRAEGEARFDDLAFDRIDWVATSGLLGDGVTTESTFGAGTTSSSLVAALSATPAPAARDDAALRMPVQTVIRHEGRRWYAGRLALGSITAGDTIRVARSGMIAEVAEVRRGAVVESAVQGQSVSIQLDRELDIARGDVILSGSDQTEPERVHVVDLVWLDANPLDTTRSYLLRSGPSSTPVRVDLIRHVVDIDAGTEHGASEIVINDMARVELVLDRPLLLDSYSTSRESGGLILIDRATARTVAAGMVVGPAHRESEVTRFSFAVSRNHREEQNGVRGVVVWLTGRPSSGKSTIADAVERELFARGIRSYTLDGDAVRSTLNEDLGFSPEDRKENVRRVARVAELMLDAGLVVLVSLVSPFRADRAAARERFAADDFVEVYVETPLEICEARDPKGLYARARASEHSTMTGIGQVYEAPLSADIVLDGTTPVEASARAILDVIERRRIRG